MALRWPRSVFKGFAVMTLAALALISGMGVSFLMVRQYTRDLRMTETVPPEALHRARLLRGYSNDLISLMNAYTERFPDEARAPRPGVQQWIEREFIPRLKALRQQMAEQGVTQYSTGRDLEKAADRAAAMAAHPADSALRQAVLRDLAKAADNAERFIREQELGPYLPAPPARLKMDR
jgi:LPS O-antigen subunit length determinant protein (WzzB/FepE family)